MVALAALALIAAASSGIGGDRSLPPQALAIALRVSAPGLPGCRSYQPDGSEGPCLPRFTARPGNAVNGWHLGGRITFTEGAFTRLNEDEFALLAGHEIAHWYLGHTRSGAAAELDADRLGAELACRAGFDPARGASVFRFLRASSNHPRASVRRAAVLKVPCPHPGQQEA